MSGKYNRKDHLYNQAKSQGYRSRAAFKLLELQKKYNLIRPGHRVLDLGCWPGGWLQVAAELAGANGKIVGVDLAETEFLPSDNVKAFQGDASSEETLKLCMEQAGGPFDVVLSDMSPKLSGIREVDESGSVRCAEIALEASSFCLKAGGGLVIKVFKSAAADNLVKLMQRSFNKVVRAELEATRKTSNEFYIISSGFRKGGGS